MKEIINYIGNFSPIILLVLSIYLLHRKPTILFFYCIGFLVNSLFNVMLKLLIKQPRPSEDERLFYLQLNNLQHIEFNKLGMPSGHAQSVFYSTIFIYFASNYNISIVSIYLLASLVTSYQRVEYNYHTTLQVIIGSLLGLIIGYFFYILGKKTIKNKK